MSRRTLFLIFALFLITVVLLMVALYQPTTPKTAQIPPTPQPVAQTILSFGAPVISTASSTTTLNYSVPINISTGKNKVSAVQLELQYDPLILTDIKVATGSFIPNPNVLLNQIDYKTGRITYAFGVALGSSGISGNGIIANLNFTAVAGKQEKTAIIFLPKTQVAAQGIRENVLKETRVGQLTIGTYNSTPSALPAGRAPIR